MTSILGPAYFDVGKPMLEAACHDIASWKPPAPGNHFDLPFLGNVIQVELSQPNKPQLLETCPFDMANYQPETQILASLPPVTMFTYFKDMLKDLWLCWELMLFAEPIVLMAPDPKICSETVLELVDLINPVCYNDIIKFNLFVILLFIYYKLTIIYRRYLIVGITDHILQFRIRILSLL